MLEPERNEREAQAADKPAEAARGAGEAGGAEKKEVNPLFDWVSAVVTAVLTVVLVFTFLAQLISVEGPSMQPTLYQGDRLIVLNRAFCDFAAGDVVIVQQYNAPLSDRIVKRVIATEGQTVDIDFDAGVVYVDGTALEEPYIKENTYTPEGITFPLTLGENEVFLMGDNRNPSTDSRSSRLGPVDERYIVGKAVFLLVPGGDPETGEVDWGRIGPIH